MVTGYRTRTLVYRNGFVPNWLCTERDPTQMFHTDRQSTRVRGASPYSYLLDTPVSPLSIVTPELFMLVHCVLVYIGLITFNWSSSKTSQYGDSQNADRSAIGAMRLYE